MKKRHSKLRKFLLRTLLALVFLSSVVAVLTRNRKVQTHIARYLTHKFTELTGADIHIGKVEVDFLRNFHVEDLVVFDLHKDTLLKLKSLDFRVDEVNFPKNTARVTKVVLNHGFFKMGQYPNETLFNYEMIMARLSSDSSSSKPWGVKIDQVKLLATDYVYFTGMQPEKSNIKGEFNPSYIRVNNLTGDIAHLEAFKNGKFTFDITNLTGAERSGFAIDELATQGVFYNKRLELNGLRLFSLDTHIEGLFSMDWSAKDAMKDFYRKVIFQLTVASSPIRLSDIGPFAPWLKSHSTSLLCDFTLKGPLSDLKSKDFTALTSAGTELNLNYRLTGLPNVSKLVNTVKMNDCVIEMTDAMEMFAGETWGGYLARFGSTYWNAELQIPMDSFVFNGTAQTDVGGYEGEFALDFSRDESMPFRLIGETKDLQLNGFATTLGDFGALNANVVVFGDGFDENASGNFDLNVADLRYNGQILQNSIFNGTLKKGEIELNVSSSDVKSKLELSLLGGNIFGEKKSLNAQLNLSKLDFKALGFDTANLDVSGKFNIAIAGSSWDDLTGLVTIQDARFHKGNDEYILRNQLIQRPTTDYLGFKGDWAEGSISGPLKFTHTPNWIDHLSNNLVPERFKDIGFALNDSIYFNLFLPQTAWIDAFLIKGLKLGPLNIKGHYFAQNNICDLKIGPFSLEYGKLYSERVKLSLLKPTTHGMTKLRVSTNYMLVDNTVYDTLGFAFDIMKGGYQVKTLLHEKADRYSLGVAGTGAIHEDFANLYFQETYLRIQKQFWTLDDKARINFNKNNIEVNDFYIADATHFFQVDGVASKSHSDTLKVEFGNITPRVLMPFFPKGTFDSLNFRSNGSVALSGVFGDLQFLGNLDINKIKYQNFEYGSASVSIEESEVQGRLKMDASMRTGPLEKTRFYGTVSLKDNESADLDILGTIPQNSSLQILKPFLDGVITVKEGKFGGNVRISGKSNRPKIMGLLTTNTVKLGVDYLGTDYYLGGNFKVTDQGLFTMRPMKFFDESKVNFGWMTLALTHENYKNFALDLKVDSIRNMRVLKTTEKMNDLFYGNAWADGNCRIYGLFSEIDMDINLKTRPQTSVSIQYPEVSENIVSNSIKFVTKTPSSKTAIPAPVLIESDAIGKIILNIQATDDAEARFVIDKRLGDVIKGNGSGNLRLIYDRDEELYLYGSYMISKGEYAFSLPGVNLLKKINLQKGGTIAWDGDPFNARVDLAGNFEKRLSPSTLMISNAGSGNSYPASRFVSTLYMKGNLFSPQISFDLDAPDLISSGGTSANEVNSVIQRIKADKDETMRQSIALLLFGNFLPPSFSSASAPNTNAFSGTGFAGNSISTIASSVVNDLFSKYGIPTRIQVNIDDVRNATGTSNTQLFVNSEWFLSDRLRLDLNYDPTVAVLVNSVAVPINFNLEYKTSDENWRLKAFSRSNNLLLQQNNSPTTNGVSGNTLGTGVLYRREFDTFQRKKKKKSNESN